MLEHEGESDATGEEGVGDHQKLHRCQPTWAGPCARQQQEEHATAEREHAVVVLVQRTPRRYGVGGARGPNAGGRCTCARQCTGAAGRRSRLTERGETGEKRCGASFVCGSGWCGQVYTVFPHPRLPRAKEANSPRTCVCGGVIPRTEVGHLPVCERAAPSRLVPCARRSELPQISQQYKCAWRAWNAIIGLAP